MRITIIAVSLFIGFPAAASAKPSAGDSWRVEETHQDADAAALQGSEDDTRHYIFDNDVLDGEVLTSEGVIIPHRRPGKSPSLITLRPHFMPELIRMSSDL